LQAPGGFPNKTVACSETDNFVMWFAVPLALVYNLLFFALAIYVAIQRWDVYEIRGKIIVVLLVLLPITLLIPETSNFLWLLEILRIQPWMSNIADSFFIHATVYSSVISIKASSMYEAIRLSKRGLSMRGIGYLSWFSFFVGLADPAVILIYFIAMPVDKIWDVYSVQNLVISACNAFLVCYVVLAARKTKYLSTILFYPVVELCLLQMLSVTDTVMSYINFHDHVLIPLSFWSFFDSIKTLPAFVMLCSNLRKIQALKSEDRQRTSKQLVTIERQRTSKQLVTIEVENQPTGR